MISYACSSHCKSYRLTIGGSHFSERLFWNCGRAVSAVRLFVRWLSTLVAGPKRRFLNLLPKDFHSACLYSRDLKAYIKGLRAEFTYTARAPTVNNQQGTTHVPSLTLTNEAVNTGMKLMVNMPTTIPIKHNWISYGKFRNHFWNQMKELFLETCL